VKKPYGVSHRLFSTGQKTNSEIFFPPTINSRGFPESATGKLNRSFSAGSGVEKIHVAPLERTGLYKIHENRGQMARAITGIRMQTQMKKNIETEQIIMEKSSSTLCQQCSNHLRDECLVTKPEVVSSKVGIIKCSHYFQEKLNQKVTIWKL
jgi:hypothetical protein